jgi:hypothetical protein
MAADFFTIRRRHITPKSWGDYGSILEHGMASHLPGTNAKLALERTGPFIPPITLPGIGDIVLTSDARQSLESSGLSGFSFLPIEKVLIVELRWENWDLGAEEPAEFPDSGEPEDYILGQPHSLAAAAALGDLWEVSVPSTATIRRPRRIVSSFKELHLDMSTWNGADLVRGNDYGGVLFSLRARDWFSDHFAKYIEFDQFPTSEQ